jgi:UDP-N-acetylmuramate dehydrogenase
MTYYIARRRAAQPLLPSAGSVFKNPPGDYAALLIEEAGLVGARRGDAMVANEHANFIVNLGNARASDVRGLIDQVRTTVVQKLGVELEPEIQLVGDWHGSCSQ